MHRYRCINIKNSEKKLIYIPKINSLLKLSIIRILSTNVKLKILYIISHHLIALMHLLPK